MKLTAEESKTLEEWMISELKCLGVTSSETLASYTITVIKNNFNYARLNNYLHSELLPYLGDNCSAFISGLNKKIKELPSKSKYANTILISGLIKDHKLLRGLFGGNQIKKIQEFSSIYPYTVLTYASYESSLRVWRSFKNKYVKIGERLFTIYHSLNPIKYRRLRFENHQKKLKIKRKVLVNKYDGLFNTLRSVAKYDTSGEVLLKMLEYKRTSKYLLNKDHD